MTLVPFSERPASSNWEAITVPGTSGVSCRAWFRPETLPAGVAVTLPPELSASTAPVLPFSLLQIIAAVGVSWEQLASVSLYGGQWQSAATCQPLAGQQLESPAAGASPQILLAVIDSQIVHSPSAPAPAAATEQSSSTGLFNRVETEWKACQGMERQLSGLRQQLSLVFGRLGSLDRDLRPEERLAADRIDQDDWQDARRWIRDASSKVHRCIKAHDIGVTSAAGRRNVIQQTYDQASATQKATGDLSTCLHEIEIYRKELANLFHSMSSALQVANVNGIQRAQRILSRIAARVRAR